MASFRVGVGAQIVPSAAAPSRVATNGEIWIDSTAANVLKYTNPAGSTITLGSGGGGSSTIAAAYSAGASQTDSTILLDATRLGVRIRDNAAPIGALLFSVQSSGGTEIFTVNAASVALNVGLNPKTTGGAALGTSGLQWSDLQAQQGTIGGASNNTLWNTAGGQTTTRTAIGTAQTSAISLVNTTAALVGAQQYSPMLDLLGKTWETTGGTSQTGGWSLQAQGINAATANSDLIFYHNSNGTPTSRMTLKPLLAGGGVRLSGDASLNAYLEIRSTDLMFRTQATGSASWMAINYNFASSVEFGASGASQYVIDSASLRPVTDLSQKIGSSSGRLTEVWSRRLAGVEQTIAAATTITLDPASGESIRITLSGTAITTINAGTGYAGEVMRVEVIQDGTGGRSISGWSSSFQLIGGAYTPTATASKRDVLMFMWDSVATKWIECTARATNV